MSFSFRHGFAAAAAGLVAASCVNINSSLGESFIADNQLYDLYTVEFPIEDINMEMADSLSSYSLYKFTVGAVRDDTFGLTTRSSGASIFPQFRTPPHMTISASSSYSKISMFTSWTRLWTTPRQPRR